MSDIKSWSPLASGNDAAAPDGFPEGMAPGDVNNAAREVMAAVRRQHEQAEWIDLGHAPAFASASSFTVAGDVAAVYHVGRRVRLTDAGTLHGRITASSYSAPNTTVELALDGGSLSASLSAVAVAAVSGTGGNRSVTPESIGAMPITEYQEGSWTPTLVGSTTPGTPTYGIQVGRYVRIGSLVHVQGRVTISNKGGMAGNVSISGLPFNSLNVANALSAVAFSQVDNLTFVAGDQQLAGSIQPNTNSIALELIVSGAGITNVVDTDLAASSGFGFQVSYRV